MAIGGSFFSGFSPTSFLASAARLIPGYMNGDRLANKDNWSDLTNYNTVQKGQISNLFDIATFEDDVTRAQAAAANSVMGAKYNALSLAQAMAGHPGQMAYYNAWSQMAPYLSPMYFGNSFLQAMMLNGLLRSGNPMALSLPNTKPSILGG